MRLPRRFLRFASVVVLLTALPAATVAVPLLDLGQDPGRLAAGAPGTAAGYLDHHHGVCLQHGAAGWSPATGPTLTWGLVEGETPLDRSGTRVPLRSLAATQHSRAPPVV